MFTWAKPHSNGVRQRETQEDGASEVCTAPFSFLLKGKCEHFTFSLSLSLKLYSDSVFIGRSQSQADTQLQTSQVRNKILSVPKLYCPVANFWPVTYPSRAWPLSSGDCNVKCNQRQREPVGMACEDGGCRDPGELFAGHRHLPVSPDPDPLPPCAHPGGRGERGSWPSLVECTV